MRVDRILHPASLTSRGVGLHSRLQVSAPRFVALGQPPKGSLQSRSVKSGKLEVELAAILSCRGLLQYIFEGDPTAAPVCPTCCQFHSTCS